MEEKTRPLAARLGEGIFCIVYLVVTTVMLVIMKQKYEEAAKLDAFVDVFRFSFGYMMALLLVGGDAFHLIPRIIVAFRGSMWKKEFFFGLGTLVSSITMTLFYNVLIGMVDSMEYYETMYNYDVELGILLWTAIRFIILLMPQNKWFSPEPNFKWAVARNFPFVVIGFLTVFGLINVMQHVMYYPTSFYLIIMICTILSFAFYLPVALKGKEKPKLGMLMLPKTVCYMVMIGVITFW